MEAKVLVSVPRQAVKIFFMGAILGERQDRRKFLENPFRCNAAGKDCSGETAAARV